MLTYALSKPSVNVINVMLASGHEGGDFLCCCGDGYNFMSVTSRYRAMYGSDQAASIEPAALKQLVGAVRKIEVGWVMV